MYPFEELGSPSLALSIEVPRSPSLPGSGTPLWDNMSLPSSPSPKVPVPDSHMDLDRWAKRGFSEDLTLPPRQIEKPFRFLDLPLEIRNIVYELTFNDLPTLSCDGFASVREFKFADESSLARRIFDFAGSLVSPELEDDELQESTLRQSLWDDVEGRPVIGFIEELEDEIEAQDRWFAEQARRQKKVTERAQNKAKGPERWGGVLRSRRAKEPER
ncbi:hypothetical protein KCU61_g6739, partial [Aureobasidium melanogenum]